MRRMDAWMARFHQAAGRIAKAEADAIVHESRLEARRRRFQARLKESTARKAKPMCRPPRYDDIYFDGVARLDAMARGEIEDGLGSER